MNAIAVVGCIVYCVGGASVLLVPLIIYWAVKLSAMARSQPNERA